MHHAVESENATLPDIILYPRDTVMRALEVMHRYGVHLLPVVDDEQGEVMGHVSEEELQRLWSTLPLARMSEILMARSIIASEGFADERPARVAFVADEQASRSAWMH